jgi:hypothetical protein
MGGICHIKGFDLKGREGRCKSGKITLEDHLTWLAILRIEEIEIDLSCFLRRVRLSRQRPEEDGKNPHKKEDPYPEGESKRKGPAPSSLF